MLDQHWTWTKSRHAVCLGAPTCWNSYTHEVLKIDYKLIENDTKLVALGRKNSLFAGSHRTAQNAAMDPFLLDPIKKQGGEPCEWLPQVLRVMQNFKEAKRIEPLSQKVKAKNNV